ncbi:YjbH domain-containing protein, partial [Escherichia coli]|uniref:YjbH domain-containing protein n=1 Tax=Escherichia coli TaxID=562 RepID=UPI0020217833
NPPQDSHLPRVRTHVREYVQNDVYVNNLQANYFQHLGNGFYGEMIFQAGDIGFRRHLWHIKAIFRNADRFYPIRQIVHHDPIS